MAKTAKTAKRRWPMVFGGLLVAGAAAGATSALIRRRRARRSWDAYDGPGTVRTRRSETGVSRPTPDAGVDRASTAATGARDRTGDLVGARRTGQATTAGAGTGAGPGGSAGRGSTAGLGVPPGAPGENKQPYASDDLRPSAAADGTGGSATPPTTGSGSTSGTS